MAANGPLSSERLAARVFPLLGYGWQRGGQPITETDVRGGVVEHVGDRGSTDLIGRGDRDAWQPGPSARSLLPGPNMLADVWGNAEEQ